MSTIITTRSGSIYVLRVAADRRTVTRYGTTAVVNYDGEIAGDEVESCGIPVVGAAWRFRTADGPFVTTTVAAVRTI